MFGRSRVLKGSYFLLSFIFFISWNGNAQQHVKFIPNRNQWPLDVQFVSPIPGGKMILKPGMFAYHFVDYEKFHNDHHSANPIIPDASPSTEAPAREHVLHVNFRGANKNAVPEISGKSKEYYNFYLGHDPCHWASEVHAYDAVTYPSFYAGIDLKIYSAGANVKYDFVIDPEADPRQILISHEGADAIELKNGNLHITTSLAEVIEKKPYAFQMIGGKQVQVACEFFLTRNGVSFIFPDGYDACHELVIDPLLIFSTYSGSTADNWGSTATPGERGTLYSAGVTNTWLGGRFPATPGAYQTTALGGWDIGILKYDSTGSSLLFGTYLGGGSTESPHSLVMNADNELIVLGTTASANFPTSASAFDRTFNGGNRDNDVIGIPYSTGSDIIVSKFNSAGTNLLASTFLGGSNNDGINLHLSPLVRNYGDELRGDVIADNDGNIYLSTVTSSSDFPSFSGFDTTFHGGGTDGLVLKMSPDLSVILWGTILGGQGTDACYSIKLDSLRNVFVAGGTTSQDFPVTAGSYMAQPAGDTDGWICKLSADGSSMLHATFTGTSAYDQVYFLEINQNEEIYVYGQTTGNIPVLPTGVYNNPGSGQFVQKFNNALDSLVFSTVFGSGRSVPDISPTAFLVNDCNNIYMTGWGGEINQRPGYWSVASNTLNMPVTADAFQKTTTGNDFYFIVLTDDAKTFLYGTYMGGERSLTHVDGGTSRFDKGGVVYHAVCSGCNTGTGPSSDFPTTSNAWSRVNRSQNCNNAAFKFDLSSLRALIQTNSADYRMPGLQFVCYPDPIRFQNKSIGGETFEWDFGDGTKVTTTDTSSVLHAYQNAGQFRVKLKAIDIGTCKVVDSTFVLVNVFEQNIVVGPDSRLCEGSSHTLVASGGAIYEWTKDKDPSFFSGASRFLVTPTDTSTYYVRIWNGNGCVKHDTVILTVIPKIVPEFSFTRESDCSDLPYISIRNETDSLMLDDRMYFDLGDGNSNDLKDFRHQFESQGVHKITLLAEREFCRYEKSVDVPIFRLKVPNVITPDGSKGKNDVFFIQYGDALVGPQDYGFKTSLIVYNRWGTVVYETSDYKNDWSANELPSGVYYFEIEVEHHATCRNWLHILR